MPRPNLSAERRKVMIPEIARTFAELGYRRTTTAELAKRCGVRENILYRLWTDKKAMFIAAIDFIFELSAGIWGGLLNEDSGESTSAERLLHYEATHHGEFGFYRIVFAGLNEADDPEIRAAVERMYKRFHRFVQKQIETHRKLKPSSTVPDPFLAGWAIVGLGTIANVGREFGLFSAEDRSRLIGHVGRLLLGNR